MNQAAPSLLQPNPTVFQPETCTAGSGSDHNEQVIDPGAGRHRDPSLEYVFLAVRRLLLSDPRLQPFREKGLTLDVAATPDRISVRLSRYGRLDDLLEACVNEERWWLPHRSGRARVIAEQLAARLLEQQGVPPVVVQQT